MPRTIRTKVYKFDELSEAAQQKAVDNCRSMFAEDSAFSYDEAYETVKEFHDIFGTKEGRNSWLDINFGSIEDNVLELKGLRLRKYIWNNYKCRLFSGKYYSTVGRYDANGKYHYKSRKSRVIIEHSCELTGVCWDEFLLQPIYEFLDWKLRPDYNSYMDFEALVNDCFDSLRKALEAEEEYRCSDEYVREEIIANEYEFTKDGNRF